MQCSWYWSSPLRSRRRLASFLLFNFSLFFTTKIVVLHLQSIILNLENSISFDKIPVCPISKYPLGLFSYPFNCFKLAVFLCLKRLNKLISTGNSIKSLFKRFVCCWAKIVFGKLRMPLCLPSLNRLENVAHRHFPFFTNNPTFS